MPSESPVTKDSTGVPAVPVEPPVAATTAQLSPAERSRLSQCFQRGTQNAPTNLDYAIEMFSVCVVGDPGNAIYLQSLLTVLKKKHGARKGGGLGAFWPGSRSGGLKKLAATAQWRELIKQGVEILKGTLADHGTLLAMADACGQLQLHEAQRLYLRTALDAAPADPEVNRQCARFLASHGDFDQAIACWVRISNVKSLAEEAQREIAQLQVEKTIVAGHGLTGRTTPGGGAKGTPGGSAEAAGPSDKIAALKRAIEAQPAVVEPYLELADLLEREATAEEAEAVLLKALAASGNDIKVREHLEDRQLRWARHRVHVAEKRLEAEDTPANRQTLERLRSAQLKHEVEVYSARSSRYPENVTWRYELAMRLKASGNHAEAIRNFQDVLQDARRKGAVSLELGECFQKIKQYQLAMQNYVTAVESLTDRELELRKRALYRAGVLAAGLEDRDAAHKYLSMLAGLDYGYRDVAQRLDKLTASKDKGDGV
jgi:tetratricopeptide (TPR) repeat protein